MYRLQKPAPILRYRLLEANGKSCGHKYAIFLGNRSRMLYLPVLSNTWCVEKCMPRKEGIVREIKRFKASYTACEHYFHSSKLMQTVKSYRAENGSRQNQVDRLRAVCNGSRF